MGCADGERIVSAKEYREYADECMRSAKASALVKACREFLQEAEAWLDAADLLEAAPLAKAQLGSCIQIGTNLPRAKGRNNVGRKKRLPAIRC
jgi:hypothetical protein